MTNTRNDPIDIDFNGVVHETDAAWLLQIGKRQVWLPKKFTEMDVKAATVTIPEWLAEKEELV